MLFASFALCHVAVCFVLFVFRFELLCYVLVVVSGLLFVVCRSLCVACCLLFVCMCA